MSRWTTLTIDHLKAAGYGSLVDRARSLSVGAIDPGQEAIDNATARIRRAVSKANALDVDTTKVPNSLKGVAEKLAIYDLMERIGMPLSSDQEQKLRDITSDLNRISDDGIKVEAPDEAAGTGEMQPSPSPRIEPKTRNFTDRTTDGI